MMCAFLRIVRLFGAPCAKILIVFLLLFLFLFFYLFVCLCLHFQGENLVPEQKIKNEEDHEKRRASTGAQPQLQRPHGLQLPTIPGCLGHAGPLQVAQPSATKPQHSAF